MRTVLPQVKITPQGMGEGKHMNTGVSRRITRRQILQGAALALGSIPASAILAACGMILLIRADGKLDHVFSRTYASEFAVRSSLRLGARRWSFSKAT
jgi:hypothetical protein